MQFFAVDAKTCIFVLLLELEQFTAVQFFALEPKIKSVELFDDVLLVLAQFTAMQFTALALKKQLL